MTTKGTIPFRPGSTATRPPPPRVGWVTGAAPGLLTGAVGGVGVSGLRDEGLGAGGGIGASEFRDEDLGAGGGMGASSRRASRGAGGGAGPSLDVPLLFI
jgi:hypothetical protein